MSARKGTASGRRAAAAKAAQEEVAPVVPETPQLTEEEILEQQFAATLR